MLMLCDSECHNPIVYDYDDSPPGRNESCPLCAAVAEWIARGTKIAELEARLEVLQSKENSP